MTDDVLFAHIEKLHGTRPWGDVLDAGTGAASLRWLRTLPATSRFAVTASESAATSLRAELPEPWPEADRLVVGNWTDPALLRGRVFDVVLADYLLGAIDGFAPYFQDRLFGRLKPHVGGRLYLVGQAPVVADPAPEARDLAALLRARDAAILLAGDRTYREYPRDWVERHLEAAGFRVVAAVEWPILWSRGAIERQAAVATGKRIADPTLSAAVAAHVGRLAALAGNVADAAPIRLAADWVIAAERS